MRRPLREMRPLRSRYGGSKLRDLEVLPDELIVPAPPARRCQGERDGKPCNVRLRSSNPGRYCAACEQRLGLNLGRAMYGSCRACGRAHGQNAPYCKSCQIARRKARA